MALGKVQILLRLSPESSRGQLSLESLGTRRLCHFARSVVGRELFLTILVVVIKFAVSAFLSFKT